MFPLLLIIDKDLNEKEEKQNTEKLISSEKENTTDNQESNKMQLNISYKIVQLS